MAAIVERLRLFVPHCEDPNDYLEDELLFLKAADEIERLREALHKVLGIVGNFPVDRFEYNVIKEARAALGEKE